MGIGFKLSALLAVVLATVCGGFYFYYTSTQEKMAQLISDRIKLETAVKEQEQAIQAMQKHEAEQAAQVAELQLGLQGANKEKTELEAKLHAKDLAAMGRQDSKGLEDRMNRATERVFRDLEKVTGAPPPPPTNDQKGTANAKKN
jgi:chromosome segregation ATPase